MGLYPYFKVIEATDISPEQIEHGVSAPNISYSVQPAEETSFPAESLDLVAVAQALHWFDFTRFWAEVRRTAKPGAFFCAWGYAWFECNPELETSFFAPLRHILEPYWASANRILWRGYRSEEILFPFRRVEAPAFAIEVHWDINKIIGYVRTWSAYKLATTDSAIAPSIACLEEEATERFRTSGTFRLKGPLYIAAGRVS